jgi:hypothetical protein
MGHLVDEEAAFKDVVNEVAVAVVDESSVNEPAAIY